MALRPPFTICSPVEGRLVFQDGRAAAGLRLSRRWSWTWTGASGADETVTDAEGRFAFPAVERRSLWASIIPHEPVIEQDFSVALETGETQILAVFKRNYSRNGELGGRPMTLRCVADAEPGVDGFFWGTCQPLPEGERA